MRCWKYYYAYRINEYYYLNSSIKNYQIKRGNATIKARLAQLLSDSSSSNPRWLIKFDGLPLKDEEVFEYDFATREDNSDDDSDSYYSNNIVDHQHRLAMSDVENGDDRRQSRVRSHHPHSQHYDHQNPCHHRRMNSSSNLPSEESGGESSRARAKRALARGREARSKRRQAKIQESMTNFCQDNQQRFRRLAPPPPDYHHPISRSYYGSQHHHKGKNHEVDQDVVQVKLLTGTLVLYKGLHRRAEFIPKV